VEFRLAGGISHSELRQTIGDLHPLMTAWRFLQPLLMGQVRTSTYYR